MSTLRRVATALLAALLLALCQQQRALAHPLGNFTVNHYARLEIGPDGLAVRYALDLAEIPTYQVMGTLDANGDGTVSAAERQAYAGRAAAQVAGSLRLRLDGADVPLRPRSAEIELLPGQAGLQTMVLRAWLEAPGAEGALRRLGSAGQPAGTAPPALRVELEDRYEPERVGWREMLVRADGLTVQGMDGPLPAADLSNELRRYPEDLLASPPGVRRLVFSVLPAGASAGAGGGALPARSAAPASLSRADDRLAALFRRLGGGAPAPGVMALALGAAMLLGGLHALSPGHGKTIVGAYLVGSRGTARHALFLGLTVTVVHTAGVFALLVATLVASRAFVPERVYPLLSLASGLLVLGVGLTLLRTRWRALATGRSPAGHDHDHQHSHGHQAHDHAREAHGLAMSQTHDHGFGAHTHAVPGADGAAVTWRSLLALGVSGGLLPCPSALVVGLASVALHQVLLGLVVITAFSAGLAATLVAIGLAMVYSGRLASRLRLASLAARMPGGAGWRLALRAAPVASAAVVSLAGLLLSADAARQLELSSVAAAPLLLALLVASGAALLAWRRPAALQAGAGAVPEKRTLSWGSEVPDAA